MDDIDISQPTVPRQLLLLIDVSLLYKFVLSVMKFPLNIQEIRKKNKIFFFKSLGFLE